MTAKWLVKGGGADMHTSTGTGHIDLKLGEDLFHIWCRRRSPPPGVGSTFVVPVRWPIRNVETSAISVTVCVRLRGCACIPMCAFACVLRHRYARDSI